MRLLMMTLMITLPAMSPPHQESCPGDGRAMEQLMLAELRRRPEAEAGDLYKMLLQAAMGSEHEVSDTLMVRDWLERELSRLRPDSSEQLADTIAPGGSLVRLNLRAALARGIAPSAIAWSFVETARTHPRSTTCLNAWTRQAIDLARRRLLAVEADSLSVPVERMRNRGWPAIHHSTSYRQAGRPAYRVIRGELLATLLASVSPPALGPERR